MSNPISINGGPTSPNVAYYDSHKTETNNNDPNSYSYETLNANLKNSCTITNKSAGIFDTSSTNNDKINTYIPKDTSSLDAPFYLAKTGALMSSVSGSTPLETAVNNSCRNNPKNIVNQIQYLTCQLENERNRSYDSKKFQLVGDTTTVKSTFESFSNLKFFLIIIFIITIYLLINGFFGSLDVATNIFKTIENKSGSGYSYWIGLLLGLALPIIVLVIVYQGIICKNLDQLKKLEILNNETNTGNPYGVVDNTVSDEMRKFDLLTLVLFILLIYSFVAVLFTIKSGDFSSFIYTGLIGSVLFIISIFIYILYAFIPFFDTADQSKMMKSGPRKLRLFISEQTSVSNIETNQHGDSEIRKSFFITFIFIFILACLFFALKSKNSFLNGLLGSSAILIIPLLWVFNFFIGIQYFFVYPLFLIILRFVRYMIMSILYIFSEKSSSLKDSFSEELVDQLNNFKNYSAPWGLIGVDELKLVLNILGYENNFSKSILGNNNSKNVSDNKFVSSGVLGFLVQMIATKETNMSGLIYSGILLILTILISVIILFGIAKVQS